MKKMLIVLIMVVVSVVKCYGQYNAPESVVYDAPSERYLISNVGGADIVSINNQGVTSIFVSAQGFAVYRGMVIVGDNLYVTNFDKMMGYRLSDGQEIMNVTVPMLGNITSLNDVETDGNGFIYATDMNNGRVIKFDVATGNFWTFADGIDTPNGILYDQPRNRMLVCTYTTANSKIHAISMADSSVSTVVSTPFQQLDGLSRDDNYNFFVSSWGTGAVYYYDYTFSSVPMQVASGINGPADIFYNRETDTLAIPSFNGNSVSFMPLTITGIQNTGNNIANEYKLGQNYPNPFNPATKIRFEIPNQVRSNKNVKLIVFDAAGREVVQLVNTQLNAGSYEYTFDGAGLSSGVYFYTLQTEGFVETKKMMLVK